MRRTDVRRMLGEMSSVDWLHWKVYMEQVVPLHEGMPILTASIAQAVWAVQIAKSAKKGESPRMPSLYDFIVRLGDQPDRRPPKPKVELFDALAKSFGALGLPKKREKKPESKSPPGKADFTKAQRRKAAAK